MYSREVIDEVISRNDIVDVISGYVKLKKTGSSYTGLCPFYNEKSPSFSVSGQRQLYEKIEYCIGHSMKNNRPIFNYIRIMQEHADKVFREIFDQLLK